jgi:gliding motility-associated-like protein
MRKLLFFVIFLVSSTSFASHIVGGEFELVHIDGFRYRLNLIIYFDVLNGNPGARDADVTVRIFRKRDNFPEMDVFLPFVQERRVDYFQPLCSSGEIVTDKLVYSTEIELSGDIYNDPEGYYISWERCCRNYTITNIYSQDPQIGGDLIAGQTFYLEFPPVVKNGAPFINSSPQLFPPLNDYACPNRPYWVDFAGIDVDGDSLVYTLVTPLNTVTPQALPPGGPNPGPYPQVTWRPGFSETNIMGGAPDLKISDKGFLTVTPTNQGLYVFAVKCEEYRDGEKIGEVIRDFQMLVLGSCPVAEPPLIKGKKLADASFTFVDDMSITFSNTVVDSNRCIQFEVSDPDASSPDAGFSENIWLRVIAIGFEPSEDLSSYLPSVSTATLTNGSVQEFKMCFPACPLLDGPYTLGIIAFDDACALPLSDTLKVHINVEPPDNSPAYFLTADATTSVIEGNSYQLPIEGRDDDFDIILVDILTDGFSLADFGMSFDNTVNLNGQLNTTFNWATGCDIYDFTQRTNFAIKLVINDDDLCNTGDPDTLTLDLEVILPPNTDPIISSDLTSISFSHNLNSGPIDFNVFGVDNDGDGLELSAIGKDFLLDEYEITFPPVNGIAQLQSSFSWNPTCDNVVLENLSDPQEFTFYFLLNDLDKCKFTNYDSLEVNITIEPPNNILPNITFVNLNTDIAFAARQADFTIGELLRIEVVGVDPEGDEVKLKLLRDVTPLPAGATFTDETAVGTVKSILEWNPMCDNLTEDFKPRTYELQFVADDDACVAKSDDDLEIFTIILNVSDRVVNDADFEPANVFTPNQDGVNDFYTLKDLPIDNCAGRFLSFSVVNRWGMQVFTTVEREFKWDGSGLEAGVYFYKLEFSNREYNGTLSIIY